MRYGYEVQPDGTKAVHVFADEGSRVQWIAASPSTRGVLSGNSREVKAALYRETVIFESLRAQVAVKTAVACPACYSQAEPERMSLK